MEQIPHRPFYHAFAWAYDLIIEGPIESRCDFWQKAAVRRGVEPGSHILDAGCGTGRYAVELARRGYVVTGLDASAELISIAQERAAGTALPVTYQIGDLLELPAEPQYDGILCRGVLNDLITDSRRQAALLALARALRENGLLALDVCEWSATALRKKCEPLFEMSLETPRGRLTFRSVTRLDHARRLLLIAEQHTLEKDGAQTIQEHDFVMRCWTQKELHAHLTSAGFGSIAYFGEYDYNIPVGTTDRIVAVASLTMRSI